MKLLVDMNLSPSWVPFLSGVGFEAVHWSAVGSGSAPDRQILEYASSNGFVVFTHDLEFGAMLHSKHLTKPSVIQVRAEDVLPSAIGDVVARAIRASQAHIEAGALITIDPPRMRVRVLPFP